MYGDFFIPPTWGLAFITLRPNINYHQYKDRVYHFDSSYDPADKMGALEKSLEWVDGGIPIGVIYREEKDTYMERIPYLNEGLALVDREWSPMDAEKFMRDFV